MKLKLAISAIAACTLMSSAALADGPKNKNKQRSSAESVSAGVAAAGPQGAVAGGVAASRVEQRQMNRNRNRGEMSQRSTARCVPGTASTSTSGAVFTDRRTGSAAINTNGTASGSGTVRSNSEGEVFSSTDRQGSQADAYGNSTAVAREPTRRC